VTRRVPAIVRNVRFKVSIKLLDHLGLNMYSSVPKAISEVVVNGYDADASLVTVRSSEHSIVIEDNGSGMGADSIQDQFLILASGHKRRTGTTPIFHRDPIGAKGIGKLAGLGIAKRIEVETWRSGIMSSFAIDREEMELAERTGAGEAMLDRAFMALHARPTDDPGSGTRVTLKKLRREARFQPKAVREHLAQELPLSDHFRVSVDGSELRKDEVKGHRIAVREVDPMCGLIEGFVVIANAAVASPGVITTVRGRAVGGPSFFGMVLANRRYHSTDRIAGQVEVTGLDPDDGSPTAIKTDREGFLTNHPRYEALAAFMRTRLEAIAKELEDRADAERDARRRAKLSDAVRQATDVLNAFTERERRLFQVGRGAKVEGRLEEGSDMLVPRSAIEHDGEAGGVGRGEPTPGTEPQPPRDPNLIPVIFGEGRLRFRSQIFEIRIEPLGVAAAECEIYRDRGLLVVNQDHPSYDEAERAGWSEGIVLRAVATRLACDHSSTADEAYALLDEILRFAAGHAKRKRQRQFAAAG
jgi:hypothetical protein